MPPPPYAPYLGTVYVFPFSVYATLTILYRPLPAISNEFVNENPVLVSQIW